MTSSRVCVGLAFGLLMVCGALAEPQPLSNFQRIMSIHRQALQSLHLSNGIMRTIRSLDSNYEAKMKSDFDELGRVSATDPVRRQVTSRMQSTNNEYRESLKRALGNRWDNYSRAFGSISVSTPTVSESGSKNKHNKTEQNFSTHKKRPHH